MKIRDEETITIGGEEYFTTKSFSILTERPRKYIRKDCSVGNRIRKMKHIKIGGQIFIEAQELFDFPFVSKGGPSLLGDFVEKYFLEDGELICKEVCIERCKS